MSARKYIRVSLKGYPTNHIGFTLGNKWNLSKEEFLDYVENYILKKAVIICMDSSNRKDVLSVKHLDEFLSALHFTGVKKQRAIDYIKHQGKFSIVFDLMKKSKTNKGKDCGPISFYCGPIFIDSFGKEAKIND